MPTILQSKGKGQMTNPRLPESVPDVLKQLVQKLFRQPRENRPTVSEVRDLLCRKRPSKLGIVDLMMKTMEHYMRNLEGMVEERTGELRQTTVRMQVQISDCS